MAGVKHFTENATEMLSLKYCSVEEQKKLVIVQVV